MDPTASIDPATSMAKAVEALTLYAVQRQIFFCNGKGPVSNRI